MRKNSDINADIVTCKDCIHKPVVKGANHKLDFPDEICPCLCEDHWYSYVPDDDWFCKDGESND